MESYRVYKSMPINDFMQNVEFIIAKGGLLLTPMIQDFNQLKKENKNLSEEKLKKKFMEMVKKTIEKEKDRMRNSFTIMDFGGYYQVIPEKKDRRQRILVSTPAGDIGAVEISDDEFPGISLYFRNRENGGEPGAILEYSSTQGCIQLRVYGKDDPDGDPIAIYDMSERPKVKEAGTEDKIEKKAC